MDLEKELKKALDTIDSMSESELYEALKIAGYIPEPKESGEVMEDNLENFTKEILGKYNATPDEWDHFEVVKDTRATDPLLKEMAEEAEKMKEELKRLYIDRDERNFAYMADDSVPRLVFNASIDAIANKDLLLKQMAEALEYAIKYHKDRNLGAHSDNLVKDLEQVIQSYSTHINHNNQ